jgi:hypothetical protein
MMGPHRRALLYEDYTVQASGRMAMKLCRPMQDYT